MNPFLCLHLIWTHLVKKQNFTGRSCLLNNRFLHLRCCDRTVTANSELWPYVARITMPFMLPRKTILHKVNREEIEIILRNFKENVSVLSIFYQEISTLQFSSKDGLFCYKIFDLNRLNEENCFKKILWI